MSLVVRNFFKIFDVACDRGLLTRIDAEVIIRRFAEKTKSEFFAESGGIRHFFSSVDFFLQLLFYWSVGEGSKVCKKMSLILAGKMTNKLSSFNLRKLTWFVRDDTFWDLLAVIVSSASRHQIVLACRHLSIAIHVLQVLSKSVGVKADVIILAGGEERLAEVLTSRNLRPIWRLRVERVDIWRTLACAEIALHICWACRAHCAWKKWLIFIPSTHRVDVIKQTLLLDLTFLIFENMFILTVLDLVAGRITAGKVKDGVFRQHTVRVLELVELAGDLCIVTAGVAGVLEKQ
jgi:hypothetical protein